MSLRQMTQEDMYAALHFGSLFNGPWSDSVIEKEHDADDDELEEDLCSTDLTQTW